MNLRVLSILLVLSVPAVASAAVTAEPTKEQLAFFESKVRPILAENCYKCHSAEKGKSKGGLTLDSREGWEKGGENGAAIAPGSPEKSLIIKAISYLDAELQMPPKGEKLSAAQIATLTEWVKMGAPDPRKLGAIGSGKLTGLTDKARQHWAYQPIKEKPAVPVNKNQKWCLTPVDAFILQKLEAKKMEVAPDTDQETLLRRATYDLTGLPPTLTEIDAFLADKSSGAFEKVVDRLLASPQYGERWGRFWLDTARYSDTIGDRGNKVTEYRYPDAWTYRDYVVQSFNQDKPYDRFILEQLAADKLPDVQPGDPRLAALGFITVGERFKKPDDVINDRIDAVCKGFLGLTVTCARCHDHMFDPIPTKDYYALHGIFNSIREPDDKPSIAIKATPKQQADFQKKYAAALKDIRDSYFNAVDHYLAELRRAPEAYLKAAIADGAGKGKKKGRDQEALLTRNELIQKNKLEEQFVQYLIKGMAINPGVWKPLQDIQATGHFTPTVANPERDALIARKLEERLMDAKGGKATKSIGKVKARMQTGPNRIVSEAFTKTPPKTVDDAIGVYVKLFATYAAQGKAFVAAMKNAESASVPGFDDVALVDFLRGPFEVVPAPLATLDWIESAHGAWPNKLQGRAKLNFNALNILETAHAGAPGHAMIVADSPRPKDSPVFIRGQSEARGDIVPRRFLEVLSPSVNAAPFTEGSGRYELAQCIAHPQNPLTARVLVNRVWMHHFGEGFVRTPDDIGVQSEAPTHQELHDYLAKWFVDNGWSLKQLHKVVMLSHVYRQSSRTVAEYEKVDPENRLLWRANIRRLDFEAMRDSLLVFSGQLDRTLGGKPINLTDEPYSNRRSVYGYIDRGNLPELMLNFDFSDPDMPNSKRTTTIVPQQALFFMNSPMSVDVARKIVARPEVANATADYSRIASIYRVIFQRSPSPHETQLGLQFINGGGFNGKEVPLANADTGKPSRADRQKSNAKEAKFGAIQNEGAKVERKALTPLETYAQALLFANEAAYVN